MSKFKQRAKKYGPISDLPGTWASTSLQCPHCGNFEAVEVEYDMEQEGGASPEPVACRFCDTEYLFSYEHTTDLTIERRSEVA